MIIKINDKEKLIKQRNIGFLQRARRMSVFPPVTWRTSANLNKLNSDRPIRVLPGLGDEYFVAAFRRPPCPYFLDLEFVGLCLRFTPYLMTSLNCIFFRILLAQVRRGQESSRPAFLTESIYAKAPIEVPRTWSERKKTKQSKKNN